MINKQILPTVIDDNNETQANSGTGSPGLFQRSLRLGWILPLLFLVGCGYSGYPLGGSAPPAAPGEIGNWQIQATSTAGASPFSALAGFIDEPKSSGSTDAVTAQSVFQATPDKSTCFSGATTIPSQGTLTGTALVLNAFSVNGQYINFTATQDASATHLTGNYVVRGGCAANAAGTLDGTRYDPLTGTYQGALSGGQSLNMVLTQDDFPNGEGYFPMSGSATFSGTTCLSNATVDGSSSYIIGSSVSLVLSSSNGVRLLVRGTSSPDATSIQVSSIEVTGGGCSDTFAQGTLTRAG